MKPCPRGKLVKRIKREMPDINVVPIREAPDITAARVDLLASLKTYCIAKCGGCDLTR